MENLHSRIKSRRINQGLSQARLAKETGVSQPTVANWENGSHIPRKNALSRIGQALKVEESWLLSGQESQTQRSVEAYLARPIRHVPIYGWPAPGQGLFENRPEGYIPYPTVVERAFALVDRTETIIRHRIMIFDPSTEHLKPTDHTLWTDGFTAKMNLKSEVPGTALLLGRLKTKITTY